MVDTSLRFRYMAKRRTYRWYVWTGEKWRTIPDGWKPSYVVKMVSLWDKIWNGTGAG